MTKEEEIEILKIIIDYGNDISNHRFNYYSKTFGFRINNGNFKVYEYLIRLSSYKTLVLSKENYKILIYNLSIEKYEEMKEKIIQYEKEIIEEVIKPEKKVEKKKNKKRL